MFCLPDRLDLDYNGCLECAGENGHVCLGSAMECHHSQNSVYKGFSDVCYSESASGKAYFLEEREHNQVYD